MKVPEYVRGAIAPVFSVFQENGALDEEGQRTFLNFLLQSGDISAYFVRSGMGLMYTYSMEDTKQMARVACAHLRGKGAVLVGCSGIWDRNLDRLPDPDAYLAEGIELGQYALDQGADGVVYTVPECLKPAAGQTESDVILRYFEALCAKVPGPVLIYQPPVTPKNYEMSPEVMARLADMDNVVGAKVSSVDGYYLYELLRAVRGKEFGFIIGCEMLYYAGLTLGARACIGQGTTVNPQLIRFMLDAYDRNDWQGVLEAQDAVNLMVQKSPSPVDFLKTYATEKGFPTPLHNRSQASNPYMSDRAPMTREEYDRFKPLFEETIARFS